ncbi:cysteine-rich CWC family protein [Paraburkholderia sp. MMS20-SJTN17]|uniref:Cysteine-rich CWC family protein n=2 Tax=Paraburkholderia translucens TaxID=2886945 RepID=A0ABS8KB59_9BURK|nr:cysteine-rich CWC family protein [Paraburkholderia sp. MMS20-SJTN17]MCC8401950.1 cysteine-rich CWC family protein [Paraburkholderia sp. MMS20-SJTN17]
MKPSVTRSWRSARCPRCGNTFDCAMQAEPSSCWCRALPPLPAERLEPGGQCLCPECLAAEIARATREASGDERP